MLIYTRKIGGFLLVGGDFLWGEGCLAALMICALWFMRVGGRFRASKAAESRRGENEIIFPPDPPLGFHTVGRAAAFGAALVAEGSFEFPLDAEGTLCKVAARGLLEVSVQPLGAEGDGGTTGNWGRRGWFDD